MTIKAKRARSPVVVCKICGHQMLRYQNSPLWFCTNLDMGHRGLVPDTDVPRWRSKDGQLFFHRKAAGSKATRLETVEV